MLETDRVNMSKVQMLRSVVNQRLTAAAQEIFGLFERTISEYEEELSASKEENERQRRLLDAVFNPEVRIHRADVQQLLVVKEEVQQQDWRSSLDKEDPDPPHIEEDQEDPEPQHIKEDQEDPEPPHIDEDQEDPEPPHIDEDQEDPEPPHIDEDQEDPEPPHIDEDQEDPESPHIEEDQEELWTSQEGEQLQGLEEAGIKFSFTPDEEEAQSFQLHQSLTEHVETEADGEDCGGPDRKLGPDRHPDPDTHEETGDSNETDTDDSDDWKQTREPQSGLNFLNNYEASFSDSRSSAGDKPFNCSQGQEGEQLQGLEEAGIKFSFTPVKSEDDEEEAQSSQLHQRQTEHMETEAAGEDCGGPEPDRNSDTEPDRNSDPDPDTDEETGDSSEPDTDDSDDWKQTREPQSGLSSLNNYEASVSDSRSSAEEKPFSCSQGQEGEQLQGLEEAGFTFLFTPAKREDDEEEAQSSQLHQRLTEHMETEADGEDCGGPEPDRNSDPERDTDEETGDSSEPDTDDSDDLKETREPQLGLHSLNNDEASVSDSRSSAGEKPFGCSECWKRFRTKRNLKEHMVIHTGKKPFNYSVCRKRFFRKARLRQHMLVHTGQKPVMCHRRFVRHPLIKRHKCFGSQPGASSGKKPFRCSECGKGIGTKFDLQRHIRIHTGEKPFSCSVCKKSFTLSRSLQKHLTRHRKGKRFSCSICKETFACTCVAHQSSQLHQTEENREAEPPASSSTEHMGTEADGEDCGGPEPDRNSDPGRHTEPDTDKETEPYSEPEDSVDVEFWKETRKHRSGFTYQRNKKVSVKDGFNSNKKPFGCSDDEAEAEPKTDDRVDEDQPPSGPKHLKGEEVSVRDTGRNTDMKPFSSSESQERPEDRLTLLTHQSPPTGEKPSHCSVCSPDCSEKDSLDQHMRIHSGRPRFRCRTCTEEFAWRRSLTGHMEVHTKKKLDTCRNCNQRFTWYNTLRNHRCVGRCFSQLQQTQNREAELPASSSTEHMETEADGEDCGEPEPDRNSVPVRHPEPDTDKETEPYSEPDDGVDIEFWKETRKHQSGFTYQRNKKVSVKDGFNSSEKPFGCSDDEAEAEPKTDDRVDEDQPPSGPKHLKGEEVSVRDTGSNTDMKPFSSSESQERPEDRLTLLTHQSPPTEEKPFCCSLCNLDCSDRDSLVQHMRIHMTRTRFKCKTCSEEFEWRRCLTKHMEVHTKKTKDSPDITRSETLAVLVSQF